MTNFHLYLMQLWWQFFQMFVRYWPWKTVSRHFQYGLSCCIIMGLVSFRLFCKNLGNLQEFFGQMVYRPPWPKIARTPMGTHCRRNPSAPGLFCRDYQREQCSSKDHFGFIRGERKSSGWSISAQHAGRVFESMSRIERILLIVLFKLWLQKICWRR